MEFAHAGKPVGYAKWQSIYPLYINSKRTVKCGRKLPREQAVVDPTIDEIVQALGQLGFKNEENMLKEDKVHPRAITTWNPRDHVRGFSCYNEFGRVKYNLHSLPDENKMTKKELLIKVSEIVTTRRSSPQTESSAKPKKKKKGKK